MLLRSRAEERFSFVAARFWPGRCGRGWGGWFPKRGRQAPPPGLGAGSRTATTMS